NVARNLREFVDKVAVIGMLGKDRSGRQLRELLTEQDIDTSSAIEDEGVCTIVKTRIIALHQQVVRVDREKILAPSTAHIEMAVAAVRESIKETDAIIFEDYGKGFVTSELVSQIAREAAGAGKIVAADPNPRHSVDWRGVTVIKPNRAEALLAAGIPWRGADEAPTKNTDVEHAGKTLLKKRQTQYVLITLSGHRMMPFLQNEAPHHLFTNARPGFAVSGANRT